MTDRPLWRCPSCGRRFANRNQWHSCGRLTVAGYLRDKPPAMRRLYRRFAAMVRRTGTVRTHPMKTRIAFISRMTFAGITLGAIRARIGIIAARRIDSPRFAKVERYGPRSFGHYLDVRTESELDDELQGWLDESAAVGRQEHLRGPATARGAGAPRARAPAAARDRPRRGRP